MSREVAMKRLVLLAAAAMSLAATGAQAQEKLKIGIIATLSGPPAVLGQQLRNGFNLAVKTLDGKLGGRDVEVIVADDELKPDLAVTKVKALVERDKVDFVVGPIFSNILAAIMKPATEGGAILISPNAGTSHCAGKECNPNFFVTSYQNDQGPALGLLRIAPPSVAGFMIAASMLEKIGPTTKSTLSRSTNALTLVTARSGLSSSSATITSTSRPPSLPSSVLTARLKPLRSCWPSTAGGPDKVAMMPILSFSCAGAPVAARLIAAAASRTSLFMATSRDISRAPSARFGRTRPPV